MKRQNLLHLCCSVSTLLILCEPFAMAQVSGIGASPYMNTPTTTPGTLNPSTGLPYNNLQPGIANPLRNPYGVTPNNAVNPLGPYPTQTPTSLPNTAPSGMQPLPGTPGSVPGSLQALPGTPNSLQTIPPPGGSFMSPGQLPTTAPY
jgi:hypothetical protein